MPAKGALHGIDLAHAATGQTLLAASVEQIEPVLTDHFGHSCGVGLVHLYACVVAEPGPVHDRVRFRRQAPGVERHEARLRVDSPVHVEQRDILESEAGHLGRARAETLIDPCKHIAWVGGLEAFVQIGKLSLAQSS